MTVAKSLREARMAKKLSQVQLAEIVGVDQSTIASWETGRRNVSTPEMVKKLSEVLGLARKWIRPDWYDAA